MENKYNIDDVNAWLKQQYGMSYEELLKEFNKAVDLFREKCWEVAKLREEMEERRTK